MAMLIPYHVQAICINAGPFKIIVNTVNLSSICEASYIEFIPKWHITSFTIGLHDLRGVQLFSIESVQISPILANIWSRTSGLNQNQNS